MDPPASAGLDTVDRAPSGSTVVRPLQPPPTHDASATTTSPRRDGQKPWSVEGTFQTLDDLKTGITRLRAASSGTGTGTGTQQRNEEPDTDDAPTTSTVSPSGGEEEDEEEDNDHDHNRGLKRTGSHDRDGDDTRNGGTEEGGTEDKEAAAEEEEGHYDDDDYTSMRMHTTIKRAWSVLSERISPSEWPGLGPWARDTVNDFIEKDARYMRLIENAERTLASALKNIPRTIEQGHALQKLAEETERELEARLADIEKAREATVLSSEEALERAVKEEEARHARALEEIRAAAGERTKLADEEASKRAAVVRESFGVTRADHMRRIMEVSTLLQGDIDSRNSSYRLLRKIYGDHTRLLADYVEFRHNQQERMCHGGKAPRSMHVRPSPEESGHSEGEEEEEEEEDRPFHPQFSSKALFRPSTLPDPLPPRPVTPERADDDDDDDANSEDEEPTEELSNMATEIERAFEDDEAEEDEDEEQPEANSKGGDDEADAFSDFPSEDDQSSDNSEDSDEDDDEDEDEGGRRAAHQTRNGIVPSTSSISVTMSSIGKDGTSAHSTVQEEKKKKKKTTTAATRRNAKGTAGTKASTTTVIAKPTKAANGPTPGNSGVGGGGGGSQAKTAPVYFLGMIFRVCLWCFKSLRTRSDDDPAATCQCRCPRGHLRSECQTRAAAHDNGFFPGDDGGVTMDLYAQIVKKVNGRGPYKDWRDHLKKRFLEMAATDEKLVEKLCTLIVVRAILEKPVRCSLCTAIINASASATPKPGLCGLCSGMTPFFVHSETYIRVKDKFHVKNGIENARQHLEPHQAAIQAYTGDRWKLIDQIRTWIEEGRASAGIAASSHKKTASSASSRDEAATSRLAATAVPIPRKNAPAPKKPAPKERSETTSAAKTARPKPADKKKKKKKEPAKSGREHKRTTVDENERKTKDKKTKKRKTDDEAKKKKNNNSDKKNKEKKEEDDKGSPSKRKEPPAKREKASRKNESPPKKARMEES